ncbi:MAG TPA: 23S rRNA (guanosine(2251)-2'-O)-methyltransferase RlmB [Spirochaetia bacterium]|nr:23S rRNA (guanosine(2251)-2'-O)-methyltransferase RlmB [Spirochaetia bacterium]
MPEVPVTGFHAIEELLKAGRVSGTLYLEPDKKKSAPLRLLARESGVEVVLAEATELIRLSGTEDHRGAVLLLAELPLSYRDNLSFILRSLTAKNALVLLMDGVTDPHNFGAVLRSADQFGAECVVVTARRSAHETQTVARTSAGASSYVSLVTVSNLKAAIDTLKEHQFWIYGADVNGEPAASLDLSGRTALVMGSEGKGLRRLVRESCDRLIRIPTRGHVDSFNVSVAAGILMYEIRRQHGW